MTPNPDTVIVGDTGNTRREGYTCAEDGGATENSWRDHHTLATISSIHTTTAGRYDQ